MSGYRMTRVPMLVDDNSRPYGFKMQTGDEIPLVFLTADGQSLAKSDGQPFTPVIAPNIQKVVPASGDTIQMTDTALDGTLLIAPATALASLTIILPTDAKSRLGQIRRIATTKAITALTLTGAVSIMNAITSMSGGDCVQYEKVDNNTWFKIQ